MQQYLIAKTDLKVPAIGLGIMRINQLDLPQAHTLIHTSMELGINFFDHADIYGQGQAESFFAQAAQMSPSLREKMILQSKCSIRNGYYDLSAPHILASVDGILDRLQTEYLDILLLHRPDALMEPEEIAGAFEKLHASGKVRYFGVSNMNPYQIALLNQACGGRILFNQMQLSLAYSSMIDLGIHVNTANPQAVNRDGGVLDYCRLHNIALQAWSPFQYGFFEGPFLGSEKYAPLNAEIQKVAQKYQVTDTAVALAWILRHPAKIQPIAGTTNVQRLRDMAQADSFTLTREEWYALYKAAGNTLP